MKPWNPRLKPVKNRYESQFLLFAVPNDIAAAADCAERNAVEPAPAKKEPSKKYGDYFGSAFRLKAGDRKGSTFALLWYKEDNYWKIVGLKIADEADPKWSLRLAPPSLLSPPHLPSEWRSKVDTGSAAIPLRVVLKRDYETALSFLSSQSYVCLDFSGDPAKKGLGPEPALQAIRAGFAEGSTSHRQESETGRCHPICPGTTRAPENRYLYKDENAIFLTSPFRMEWPRTACAVVPSVGRGRGRNWMILETRFMVTINVSSFELKVSGDEPAALHCLWGLEGGSWKILAWKVIND